MYLFIFLTKPNVHHLPTTLGFFGLIGNDLDPRAFGSVSIDRTGAAIDTTSPIPPKPPFPLGRGDRIGPQEREISSCREDIFLEPSRSSNYKSIMGFYCHLLYIDIHRFREDKGENALRKDGLTAKRVAPKLST